MSSGPLVIPGEQHAENENEFVTNSEQIVEIDPKAEAAPALIFTEVDRVLPLMAAGSGVFGFRNNLARSKEMSVWRPYLTPL
jgi:hypothetical protein